MWKNQCQTDRKLTRNKKRLQKKPSAGQSEKVSITGSLLEASLEGSSCVLLMGGH